MKVISIEKEEEEKVEEENKEERVEEETKEEEKVSILLYDTKQQISFPDSNEQDNEIPDKYNY